MKKIPFLLSLAFLLSIACNTLQQYPLYNSEPTQAPFAREAGEDSIDAAREEAEEDPIAAATEEPDLPIAPRLNSLAPNFVLDDADGNTFELWELRGSPVLINFWATWCGPCLEEMPAIQSLSEKYPELVVLGINGDGESYEDVSNYAEENELTFPLLIDAEESVSDSHGIDAFPMSFFIDRAGVIQKINVGSMDEQEFEDILTSTILNPDLPEIANSRELAIDLPDHVWSFDINEAHTYEFQALSDKDFSDFTIQADVEITDSSSEYHGLMLRQRDGSNFYSFRITPDGFFAFDIWHPSSEQAYDNVLGPEYSEYIRQGTGKVNTLTAIASGENFDLYINGEYVGTAADSRFDSGKAGVISCTCGGSSSTSSNFSAFSLETE
jgi:thiol-disulfide isomerase/thioredoxin